MSEGWKSLKMSKSERWSPFRGHILLEYKDMIDVLKIDPDVDSKNAKSQKVGSNWTSVGSIIIYK